ncbi:unnamed protein product [Tenebrio molitor]|jgi:hypothetical protein|nr:unnamed protein product [Tenebrio molitor]
MLRLLALILVLTLVLVLFVDQINSTPINTSTVATTDTASVAGESPETFDSGSEEETTSKQARTENSLFKPLCHHKARLINGKCRMTFK